MTNAPASLEHARKRFGSTVALNDVSFEIRPRELVAVLGPNGAGKTTAVRLLLGLIRADAGTARIFGGDPRKPATRTRLGAMLQVGKVPETLRVREHIELFSSYYPDPMPMGELLDVTGLRGIEGRLFGDLSGGQKQRLLFALAICGRPDLLILDEPTVGLDLDSRRNIWEQIRRFIADGRSVLLTTHYLQEADALADRVIVMERGTIIAEGTPREIKSRVASRRIRCITSLPAAVIGNISTVSRAAVDGNVVDILAADSDLVLRELIARDPSVSILELSGAGLEEAFWALTHTEEREVA